MDWPWAAQHHCGAVGSALLAHMSYHPQHAMYAPSGSLVICTRKRGKCAERSFAVQI